jgi:hypothetical protein
VYWLAAPDGEQTVARQALLRLPITSVKLAILLLLADRITVMPLVVVVVVAHVVVAHVVVAELDRRLCRTRPMSRYSGFP